MSQKASRNLLVVEAFVIALPVSFFATIAPVFFVRITRQTVGFALHDWLAVLSILCLAAIFSGWYLFVAYLRGGTSLLQKQSVGWWIMIGVGMLILIASIISRLLPPSTPYSPWDDFRSDFHHFTLALPVLIPIGHLAYERFIRKQIA